MCEYCEKGKGICKENRRKSFESERLLFIAFQISKRSGGTFWSILPLLTEIRKEHIIDSIENIYQMMYKQEE